MESIARKQYIWFIITVVCWVFVVCAAVLAVHFVYTTVREAHIAKQTIATYEQNKEAFALEVSTVENLSSRVAELEQQAQIPLTEETVEAEVRARIAGESGIVMDVVVGNNSALVTFSGDQDTILRSVNAISERATGGFVESAAYTFSEGIWVATVRLVLKK